MTPKANHPALRNALNHQAEVKTRRENLAKIQTATIDNQNRLEEAHRFDDLLPELQRRREDVLAAIAVGTAEDRDLVAIDTEIKKAKVEKTAHMAKYTAVHTDGHGIINGLNRKAAEIEEELRTFDGAYPRQVANVLKAEAELAAVEYRELARQLMVKFRRIVALGQIESTLATGETLTDTGVWRFLSIPCFRHLDAMKDLSNHGEANVMGESTLLRDGQGTWLHDDVDSEMKRLKGMGVDVESATAISRL